MNIRPSFPTRALFSVSSTAFLLACSGGAAEPSSSGGAPSAGGVTNASSGGALTFGGALATSGGAVAAGGSSGAATLGGASAAGAPSGTGGASQGGSTSALGGSSNGGSNSGGAAGAIGAGGGLSGGSTGAAGASSDCPTGASFCSGFEGTGLPVGASYMPSYQAAMWADFTTLDTTVFHSGTKSFQVKPTGTNGYSFRLLSVPVPGPSYWVRLWVRSDQDFGQEGHNSFFGASTTNGDQNTGDLTEVSEQFCQVVLNLHDDVVLSIGGTAACGSPGIKLPKDTWHCMEAFFDGPTGGVQVYANRQPVIDKAGWKPNTVYKSFVFGFLEFHGPSRTLWYDDVVVAPERVGCPQP